MELSSQDNTISLQRFQQGNKGEFAPGFSYDPSMKDVLRFADRAIITDRLQLSKSSPLKVFATSTCPDDRKDAGTKDLKARFGPCLLPLLPKRMIASNEDVISDLNRAIFWKISIQKTEEKQKQSRSQGILL